MADFIYTIPDEELTKVLDAIAWKTNYAEYINQLDENGDVVHELYIDESGRNRLRPVQIPNPVTKQEHTRNYFKGMVIEITREYEKHVYDTQAESDFDMLYQNVTIT